MSTVNYLRVVGCDKVAARREERNEGYRIDHQSSKRGL